jgi:hypothetical protein
MLRVDDLLFSLLYQCLAQPTFALDTLKVSTSRLERQNLILLLEQGFQTVYRLAYNVDVGAFKSRRQGGPSRTGVRRAHI